VVLVALASCLAALSLKARLASLVAMGCSSSERTPTLLPQRPFASPPPHRSSHNVGSPSTASTTLRDAHPAPIPVISTAFRPITRTELAVNPFRVFTSMLVPEDRRFFDQDLEARLKTFLSRRQLFSPELLDLADQATSYGELPGTDAARFLERR
jgi:Domain of unknown function (DUF1338)